MTVNDLIRQLQSLREDLRGKEIHIIAPNGIEHYPEIKLRLKDQNDALNLKAENVEKVMLVG